MRIQGQAGDYINEAAARAVQASRKSGESVELEFNEIVLTVVPESTTGEVVMSYHAECDRRREEYVNSDAYRQQQAEQKQREKEHAAALASALKSAPEHMTVSPEKAEKWAEIVRINSDDGYGAATVRFAERWSRLMEAAIAGGKVVADVADPLSHLADDEGITGFMYGCAVGILANVWIHGEELRRWHNLSTQIGTEGERANESDGVLNPAVITFKVS